MSDDTTNNSCASCGATSSSSITLQRCSRCLTVKYCSRDCQHAHWKQHKPSCNAASTGIPPEASRTVPSKHSLKAAAGGVSGSSCGYRHVTVEEPVRTKVLGCCWCCAMLLKVCGPNATNPNHDMDGPIWTKTYGRSMDETVPGVVPYPATLVLGTPGSTGFYVPASDSGLAAACYYCYANFQQKGEGRAEAHIKKCVEWLRDDKIRASSSPFASLPPLNIAEKRMLALISLDQTPDLSHGKDSIAGRFTKKGNRKKLDVPFSFKDLEEMAFPTLLCDASGFKGTTLVELMHYTLLRLYSAESRWRDDPDYVVFSVHRLAAFGLESALETVKILPAPVPNGRLDEMVYRKIGLKPGFM